MNNTTSNDTNNSENIAELEKNITALEESITKLENYLYNAIISWYDDSLTEYHGLDDEEFGKFLNVFVDGLRNKAVDGQLFDRVDDTGSTKDKANITIKLHFCVFIENGLIIEYNLPTRSRYLTK